MNRREKQPGKADRRKRSGSSSKELPAATPLVDDERRRRQLAVLDLFGTIDFDLDYDPLEMRRRDRERLKREIEARES